MGVAQELGTSRCWLTAMAVCCAVKARADVYFMDFPLRLNQVEIAQVSAGLDGFTLDSVMADEFARKMQKVLSESVLAWLEQKGKQPVSLAELDGMGVELAFLPQDMVILMRLKEKAMATGKLSYGRRSYVVKPQDEAGWAFLSNFNFNHRRTNNNSGYESRVEWLMNGNFGGGDGMNFRSAVFWDDADSGGSQTYRSDVKFFFDDSEAPRRLTFGDTQNRAIGHLGSYAVGGFSIEKDYADLQPQRNLTPGNSQVFVLPRPATVEVYVNGFMLSRSRLRPGRYDINDLPLTSGSNRIRVVATYADGKTQQFDFTTHYNAQLLAKGLSDYSFVLGRPSSVVNNIYHYDSGWLASGMYEYGVSDSLTLGVNGVARSGSNVLGTAATLGYDWGNVSLRYSKSHGPDNDGHAFSIETEHSVSGQSDFGSPNLHFGLQSKRDFSTTPWFTQSHLIYEQRFTFDYSYYFNRYFDLNMYGSLLLDKYDEQTNDYTVQVNWRDRGVNVSLGYSHGNSIGATNIDSNRLFINFTWSLFDTQSNTRQRLRYNSKNKTLSGNYAKINRNYMDDYGYELLAEKGSGYRREQLRSSYTGRLLRADVDVDNTTRDGQPARSNQSVNLSTSIGVADGHVGVGANITAPFAVISKHKSLGHSDVLVNINRKKQPQTQTGEWVGALINLGTGYSNTQFNIDIPDAPFGYDWGPGTYRVATGANTGHYFQIGSAESYTTLGVLLDDKGAPLSLKRGTVTQLGHDSGKTVFTNRAGRFVVEGVGTGTYIVRIDGLEGQFIVADSEERFIEVGDIRLKATGSE